MRVTLVRHGAAGEAARDEDRALTAKGRKAVERVGRTLAGRDDRFDVIVTSPLVRAVQTAELVAAAIDHDGEILVDRALVPEAPPRAALALLSTIAENARVALVGHEPNLSSVAARLLGLASFRPLRKGEALRIKLATSVAQPGELRWCVDPETGELAREG